MSIASQTIKSLKGFVDILPKKSSRSNEQKVQHADKMPATPNWQYLEHHLNQLMLEYGYEEIRLPVLENTNLFKRSIGEVTDIVTKEMFTLQREEQSLTLRPEGTASCVRACLEHSLIRNQQVQKLWYMGPMFRAENPMLGRYRQFTQLGVESFNLSGPGIDAEHIVMMHNLWQRLGIAELIHLEINTLGDAASRAEYRKILVDYFNDNIDLLDEDSKKRLTVNPLRILDSKNQDMANLIKGAPKFLDYIDEESNQHFNEFKSILDTLNIPFTINPTLVRGLDYYNRTVYEWVTDKLGSQSAVCAGGRYDNLVEQIGGQPSPAVGFAMGLDRILLLMQYSGFEQSTPLDGYLIVVGNISHAQILLTCEKIHRAAPGFKLLNNFATGNLNKQLKKADKSTAKLAIIIGEDEVAHSNITIKPLRRDEGQQTIAIEQLIYYLEDNDE